MRFVLLALAFLWAAWMGFDIANRDWIWLAIDATLLVASVWLASLAQSDA